MNRTRPLAAQQSARRRLAAAGILLAASSLALADPPKAPPNQDPALKGPAVSDRNVPGVEGSFGSAGGDKKRPMENRLPPRAFRQAMDAVMAPDAPENLRVSDQQREKFEGWFKDFEKSMRTYTQEHRNELARLRRGGDGPDQAPPGQPRDDMRPDGPNPASGQPPAASRERFREIMEGAPKIEDVYTKVWAELSPAQRQAVDTRIQDFRDRESEQRQERYVEQRLGKRGQGGNPPRQGDAAPPPPRDQPGSPAGRPRADGPGGDRAGPISPERRERLMRLLSRMTPEQQDQLIQRLEERLRSEGGDGPDGGPGPNRRPPGNRRGAQAGGNKPPPQMDDVNVPPPPPPPPQPREQQP